MKRLAFFAIAGLGAAVVAGQLSACVNVTTGSGSVEVVFDESYPFAPGGEVVASLGSADVEIRTSARSDARVTVEGTEKAFEQARFTVTNENGRLTVATKPQANVNIQIGRSLQIVVEVPEDVSVNAEVGSGEVTIGTVRGALAIETGSGDVETGDVGAAAEIETGSGSVSTGDVAGGIDISTGSGDVSFAVSRAAPVSVETGSGDVDGVIPADAGFSLSIGTGSGNIDVDGRLGLEVDGDDRDLEVEIGGGGPPLRIGTGSGDVDLRAR